MPSNRSNSERGKAFDIDTKIEYMNKLYEVRESNQCCDCSLATICSSSDISAGDRNDDALSRDKRINIFGECSSLRRLDKKSVVFVEVPTTKELKVYNTILYEIDYCHKYITIDIPEGSIIDTENSDLSKGLIVFKDKWLNLKQLYKSAKDNNYHTCFSEIKDSTDDKSCTVRDKLIALANLMDIASYFNGGWEYNVTEEVVGYSIAYYKFVEKPHYSVCEINNSVYTYYGSPVFKNKADAQYVINNPNFRSILDIIFKS